jgi:hypothetical protein
MYSWRTNCADQNRRGTYALFTRRAMSKVLIDKVRDRIFRAADDIVGRCT